MIIEPPAQRGDPGLRTDDRDGVALAYRLLGGGATLKDGAAPHATAPATASATLPDGGRMLAASVEVSGARASS